MTNRRKTVWVFRNDDWLEVHAYDLDPHMPYRLKRPPEPASDVPADDAVAPSALLPGPAGGANKYSGK